VIEVDGDRARSRSSLLAVHVLDESDPGVHADIGGFYDCEYVRTDEGWKFSRVKISVSWRAGADLTLEETPQP
jgi:SnoaL-like domain